MSVSSFVWLAVPEDCEGAADSPFLVVHADGSSDSDETLVQPVQAVPVQGTTCTLCSSLHPDRHCTDTGAVQYRYV